MSERVARSRELVAQGRPAAVVARVAGISRQAIYRRPKRPPAGQRRPLDQVDRVVLAVARSNPTDGTRMVAALAGRALGGPVNRKRVQRLMREHALLQRRRTASRDQLAGPGDALAHSQPRKSSPATSTSIVLRPSARSSRPT